MRENSNDASRCEECGITLSEHNNWIDSDGGEYCEDCYYEYTECCEVCEDRYHLRDLEGGHCINCEVPDDKKEDEDDYKGEEDHEEEA